MLGNALIGHLSSMLGASKIPKQPLSVFRSNQPWQARPKSLKAQLIRLWLLLLFQTKNKHLTLRSWIRLDLRRCGGRGSLSPSKHSLFPPPSAWSMVSQPSLKEPAVDFRTSPSSLLMGCSSSPPLPHAYSVVQKTTSASSDWRISDFMYRPDVGVSREKIINGLSDKHLP